MVQKAILVVLLVALLLGTAVAPALAAQSIDAPSPLATETSWAVMGGGRSVFTPVDFHPLCGCEIGGNCSC